ncbi:MAG: hypothetical protein HY040_28335 [Planctomycetes bacterium]|nr:hypothetical protein [Planctomycetota bacterium]
MANEQADPSSPISPVQSGRFDLRLVAVSAVVVAAVVGAYFVMRTTSQNGQAQDAKKGDETPPSPYFRNWDKPDLAIVVTGEMHGYTQPCGCSSPQYGGLIRRYNFLKSLKEKGWPLVSVDLGDIAAESGPQAMLKYELSMKALDFMGYSAIGLGRRELMMPLKDALAHYSLNNPKPVPLAATLANAHKEQKGNIFYQMNARPFEIVDAAGFKVGIVGAIGQNVAEEVGKTLPPQVKADMQFLDNPKVIPEALEGFSKAGVDISILLYQGLELEPRDPIKNVPMQQRRVNSEAFRCAQFLHQARAKNPNMAPVHLLVCLSDDPEPPGMFTVDAAFPNTRIVTIGQKGKFVGVVGIWKTKKGLEFKYDIRPIGPEFEPKDGDNNPVLKLKEAYALTLKNENYLAKFPRGPHPTQIQRGQGRYEGSDRCAGCHDHASKVWDKSAHAHAFKTLETAKLPSLRQYDGECVVCHTVGFKHNTGYYDPPNPKQLEKHNLKLRNVGCENCHGPCSEHANNPQNQAMYPIINPFRPRANETPAQKVKRFSDIDAFCQKCHDIENDVHWGQVPFAKKWELIAHPTPKKNNGN